MGKFTLKKVPTGIKFDLRADNGEIIAVSEVYKTEAACKAGIQSICRYAPAAATEDLTEPAEKPVSNPKFQLYRDRSGAYRFRLRARNGKIIAASEGYTTKNAALLGIESVKENVCPEELT